MINLYTILRRPIITDKTSKLLKDNKITFEVIKNANKYQIKNAFYILFNVKKLNINTLISRGKIKKRGKYSGKRKNKKKAIIKLNKEVKASKFILQE